MKREFKGIWIDRDIWLSKDMTLQEKVFYVEICSLDNENGCFANNEYFSEFFGVSKVRVSEVINSLVRKGYISSIVNPEEGNKRILKTLANFSLRPSQTKVEDPLKDSFIHSNTINNTKNKSLNLNEEVDTSPSLFPVKSELKKEESAHHRIIKKFFEDMHPEFVFQPVHAKSAFLFKNNIKALFKKKKRETDEKSVGDFAVKLLDELPAFFLDKDLATINSKFNEIISQLTDQNNGNSKSKRPESKYAPKR